MQKIRFSVWLLALTAILFTACDYKRSSYGDFERIIVFADSLLYRTVRPQVEQVFDEFVYTPVMEKSFYTDWKPLRDLDVFQQRRNLIFIADLSSNDMVSSYIKKMVQPEILAKAENGEVFQIYTEDLFAREQFVIILLAKNAQVLRENLIAQKENLFERMDRYHMERLERAMFLEGEQTALEEYLADKYGWKLRIQYDYNLIMEREAEQLVWFKRLQPERSLMVFRLKAEELPRDERWLFNLRDSLAAEYFEGDSISTDDTYSFRVDFNGRSAWKLMGVWQNRKRILGGPFHTYAFHDNESGYIYIIDLHVTAPGKRKKPYMDQLEVMARSFVFSGRAG